MLKDSQASSLPSLEGLGVGSSCEVQPVRTVHG